MKKPIFIAVMAMLCQKIRVTQSFLYLVFFKVLIPFKKLNINEEKLKRRKRNLAKAAYFTLFILNSPPIVFGQTKESKFEALTIGDSIPKTVWDMPLTIEGPKGKQKNFSLGQMKDSRLIILEFWGSQCPPCIRAMDSLNLFSETFKGHVRVLPFLTQSHISSVSSFMKKRGWNLPTVVKDTLFQRQVFNKYLTGWGDVWILDGRLIAVPKHGYITKQTIQNLLKGQAVNFVNTHNVRKINPQQALFRTGNGGAGIWYKTDHSSIGRYMPDQQPQPLSFISKQDSTIVFAWNQSLEQLLYSAYKKKIHSLFSIQNGIEWNIGPELDARLFKQLPQLKKTNRIAEKEAWLRKNWFGYNLRLPSALNAEQATEIMQGDLNKFFGLYLGIQAHIETKSMQKFAVLRLMGSKEETTEKLTKGLTKSKIVQGLNNDTVRHNNLPFGQHFLMRLGQSLKAINHNGFTTETVLIDSTGIDRSLLCYFEFPQNMWGDLSLIRKELARYRMTVSIEHKFVPILVVTETRKKSPAMKTIGLPNR
ncbi:TlpA family protein disulfide reductase [Pedobacter psychrotolerans]|uniref:TlpA family protein disulfide reductase n=1 Tax=Pedobacter psychrotolerans TaxID=1843235 RepID=UPI003F94ADC0